MNNKELGDNDDRILNILYTVRVLWIMLNTIQVLKLMLSKDRQKMNLAAELFAFNEAIQQLIASPWLNTNIVILVDS